VSHQNISALRPELALTPFEHEVIAAVVTKFAADLVLFRLSKAVPGCEAAALEEVATAAAMMLKENRTPTLIESLAIQAIMESVSSGATDEFFNTLSSSGDIALPPARLRQVVCVIHGKLAGESFRAAA
jgi:hypothetical protein